MKQVVLRTLASASQFVAELFGEAGRVEAAAQTFGPGASHPQCPAGMVRGLYDPTGFLSLLVRGKVMKCSFEPSPRFPDSCGRHRTDCSHWPRAWLWSWPLGSSHIGQNTPGALGYSGSSWSWGFWGPGVAYF